MSTRQSFSSLFTPLQVLITLLLVVGSLSAHAASVRSNYSSVELVAEVSSVSPGQSFMVGLDVAPDSKWHHYWINPGDAGKPMEVEWDLPPGVSVGEITFPAPHVVPFSGLISYGYNQPNTLLLPITAPQNVEKELTLKGMASWLVCDDKSCVPERAPVSLTLPVGSGEVDIGNAGLFRFARQLQPKVVDWPASFIVQGNQILFEVAFPFSQAEQIYLFPKAIKFTNAGAGQQVELTDGLLKVTAEAASRADKTEQSSVVIRFVDGAGKEQVVEILEVGRVSQQGTITAAAISESPSIGAGVGFWGALVFAFIGGIILNLMPCVLPVLSLKVLSLVKMADQHPRWVRENGLFYTGGILLSFAVMAGVIIAIKASGQLIGWGFQLQNPIVILSLAMLMVLIALNLFGVFEIGSGLANAGGELTEGRSNRSAFFTGVLAVLVATPCTAPFMATALGFAFVQPWYSALAIFLALGFGLAFPYLLVAFVPGAQRLVPQPGPWMAIFKTALAFPMLATAIWLISILGDNQAMLYAMVTALVIAIAGWAWGQVVMSRKPAVWRGVAILAVTVAVLFPARWAIEVKQQRVETKQQTVVKEQAQGNELRYSDQGLAELLGQGETVFAYFTADWCITCKANERASLQTEEVQDYFSEQNIKVMVGDYTNYNDEITLVLQRYYRAGVPLYLYFQPGDSLESAKVLPQTLLSPAALIRELN